MISVLVLQEPNLHLDNTNTPNLKASDTNVNIVNITVDYENSLRYDSVKYVDIKRLSKGSRTEHMKVAHSGIEYICDKCDFKSKRKGHFKKHTETMHEGVQHTCAMINASIN